MAISISPSSPFNLLPCFLSPSTSQSSSSSLPIPYTWKRRQTNLNARTPQTPLASTPHESPHEECPETEHPSGDLKRKKLRPSFYDQTIQRWSVKISSQRSKFPWQVQEAQEVERNRPSLPTRNPVLPAVHDCSSRAQHFGFPLDNRAVPAPWAHGGGSSRTKLNSEARTRTTFENCEFGGEGKKSGVGLTVQNLYNRSLDQNRSPLDGGAAFADSDDEKQPHSEKTLHPSLPSDENSLNDKPVGLHLKQSTVSASRIPLKSFEIHREGEKSKVRTIIDKLKTYSDQNSSSINASSNDEHEHESGGSIVNIKGSVSFPWIREGDSGDQEHLQKRSNTKLAERMIPEPELRRLRNAALRMKERKKVGPAGVTEALVKSIHEKWKEVEVVKLKFEGPPALNMKRMHELLERKTEGLVIWRSGSSLVLYRGMNYKLQCVQSYSKHADSEHSLVLSSQDSTTNVIGEVKINGSVKLSKRTNADFQSSFEDTSDGLLDTFDIDSLLDELGPRFKDWSGRHPLPVDADLLPCVVPGYTTPFRLLPYKTKHGLQNREMTRLRQLARTVPPHFALGRNRQHQGLAQAMVKLWEKSSIAKIAIKRGVLNTCNERMAEELKKLTGGTLLSRNKDYIVIYRGNDFLTPSVTEVLVERQKLATVQQDEEEQARLRASDLLVLNSKTPKGPFVAGTFAETEEAKTRWGNQQSRENVEKMMRNLESAKHASLIRYLEKKLALAQLKVSKAERALRKVQEFLEPAELPTDLETVTDEERFLFRKIGLKMTAFLSLGRRGVFDGSVENMHLNWKHRELVKIIVKGKSFAQVKHMAISLEAESGGVLISLDKTTKGYAIIIYRGKNYNRPYILKPKNLLTRRQALARSIELQRREALIHHISNLQQRIEMLKAELDQKESVQDISNKGMNAQLTVDFSSDEEVEDEGEEAYLETFNCNDENGDGDDVSVEDS